MLSIAFCCQRTGDDLVHDRGLGIGVMLHPPPGPPGQVALDLGVGVTVGVVRAEQFLT